MAKPANKNGDLASIEARRELLRQQLAELDEQAKAAALAAKDAGREVLLAALERVKISAMDRSEAKAIAKAIEKHGGADIARKLESMDAA
jgi:hypothetical protein